MLLFAIILTCVKISMCVNMGPGEPVPGADLLEEIFTKHLKFEGSVFNFLKGKKSGDADMTYTEDNLDLNILDVKNVRKLISIAKKKYKDQIRRNNFANYRRLITHMSTPVGGFKVRTAGFKKHKRYSPYLYVPKADLIREIDKIYEMMQQSIYASQYRLEATLKYRKRFSTDPSYRIALLYGSCTHHINKVESLYQQTLKFPKMVHYVWYLIIYERMLVANIDINDAVERLFLIHGRFIEANPGLRREKSTMPPISGYGPDGPPVPPPK